MTLHDPKINGGLSRRVVLQSMAVAGGGFAIGLPFSSSPVQAQSAAFDPATWPGRPEQAFDYWLEIAGDGVVTVNVHMAEMGQGVTTSLPMLVADELEADWQDIRVRFAPNGPAYYNRGYSGPMESTGGSTSIRGHFNFMREIGANAREMLRAAAADTWGVDIAETRAAAGRVHHDGSSRSLGYGELAATAAKQTPPTDVLLKPRSEWRYIGQSLPRLDTPSKVDGSAGYGVDVRFDGLLVATVRHCPAYEGRLVSVDPAPALAIKGVRHVVPLDDAVAVVGDGYWPALKGLEALTPEWDLGDRAGYGADELAADLAAGAARTDTPIAREQGDMDAALEYAEAVYEEEFETPYLAHVCMEPMNATVWVQEDRVDLWMPGQGHTLAVQGIAELLGVPVESVRSHRTYLGGGLGRRGENDLAVQAARISQAIGGQPVKLIWSREEDVLRDFFRPAARARVTVPLDGEGVATGLQVAYAAPSITKRRFPQAIKNDLDPGAFGGFSDQPYALDHIRYRYALVDNGVPVGYWRSVAHGQNNFMREAMLDELAERAGMDPFAYRRRLLADEPRYLAALDALEEMSGFAKPLPAGRGRGMALNNSHEAICAQVVEISMHDPSDIRIERVDCVIDVGIAVNPDIVVAQMESSIIDGLSSSLFGSITLKDGGVLERNFDTIRMMRIGEAPEINVQVREWDAASAGGVGEPGVPPVAPALAAAIYKATGVRIRRLPIVREGFAVASA